MTPKESNDSDLILQTIEPITHDLGGFKVHRTLPAKEWTMVGPFLFFDQMGPAHLPTGEGIDGPTRISIWPPSLICSTARSTTAIRSARSRRSRPARSI